MELNGWTLKNISADEQYCLIHDPDALIECSADSGWYGWGCESSSGSLRTALKGSGIMTIRYGNCWNDGHVRIYLNGTLIDSVEGHTYKEASFEYDEGMLVEISDEGRGAAIKLIGISFSCKGVH